MVMCVICSQVYKEQVLEPMLNGTEKNPALINDYKEYHTDTTVKFVVKMTEEKLAQAEAAGLHKVFKLQASLTCNSMVSIHNGICNKLINAVRFLLQFFGFVLVWLRKHYCASSSCKYLSIQSRNIQFFSLTFGKCGDGLEPITNYMDLASDPK